MENNESMGHIGNSQMLQKNQKEYVVRGALTKCTNGEKQAVLNLPVDHGQYLQGNPQINILDSKPENIEGFGICKLTNKKCVPQLSPWINGNYNKRIWDQNTLKMEATVVDTESYCVCLKNQGIITVTNSGQTIPKKNPGRIYITEGRTAIVVNDIAFIIYNPSSESVSDTVQIKQREGWYTIMEYTMTEVEFSLSKALLGIHFEIEDFMREGITVFSNQSVQYSNGKIKTEPSQIVVVDKHMDSGTKAAGMACLAEAMELFKNMLQQLANAIEYTHTTFYFQKSDKGNHRVVLLGGTQSDRNNFMYYGYYGVERSYIHDIVSKASFKTSGRIANEMKEPIKDVITYYINKIESGKSKAKLLVSKDEVWLRDNEYYDLIVYLSSKRQYNYHHVILYPYNGRLCQEAIVYPEESLAIVKRKGVYPYFDKTTKLIELKYDTCTTYGNDKFWKIFDKVLKEQCNVNTEPPLSNPSNATFDITAFKDELPEGAKPKSAFDLMNLKG